MKIAAEEGQKRFRYPYGSLARIYEPLAHGYSLGRIRASKAAQVSHLVPGTRVLYAGVGTGEELAQAATCGIRITALDLTAAMLTRARRRLGRTGDDIEWVCADLMCHRRAGYYDAVVANFFLNLFSRSVMPRVLAHLVELTAGGGQVLVGDFARAGPGRLTGGLQKCYFGAALVLFWSFGKAALHPLYDYAQALAQLGLTVRERRQFPLLGGWLPGYETLVAVKPAAVCGPAAVASFPA